MVKSGIEMSKLTSLESGKQRAVFGFKGLGRCCGDKGERPRSDWGTRCDHCCAKTDGEEGKMKEKENIRRGEGRGRRGRFQGNAEKERNQKGRHVVRGSGAQAIWDKRKISVGSGGRGGAYQGPETLTGIIL